MTAADGGRNPTFDGKFIVTLIEGFREVSVSVWNSNTFTADELIGSTRFVHSLWVFNVYFHETEMQTVTWTVYVVF